MAVTEISKRTVDMLPFRPDSQKKLTEIIVSINRRDKARNERLPYDYRLGVAVSVRGVREGEERDGENGKEEVGKCLRLVLPVYRQLGGR